MGVKDLWNILSPSCEKKSLWELEGLTIAIDLSSWIVDSQNVGDSSHMNMYLRNLFFRTSYLLLIGVKPIFVLEGRAPTVKHDTIARRHHQVTKEVQKTLKNKNGHRGRLNCLQKQCEELLESLGVRCYKSHGEAEALCARLNELGIVDAVISQDSDCFLYGAKVVLRNFTMSPAYTCDMYRMESIRSKLGLGRHHLMGLSLLCGCDYDAGVQGIGKQSALKFLTTLADDEVLSRLRSWRDVDSYSTPDSSSQMTQDNKLEIKIRKKALLDPNFPSEEVISEFLSAKDVELPSFVWHRPSLSKFMVIADRKLAWEEDYVQSKFLPLLTRWRLTGGSTACDVAACAVVKRRMLRGVPSYEVRWQHQATGEFTTVEPVNLFATTYPELHQAFLKSKEKPKKEPRGKKKKNKQENELQNIENLMGNMNISGEPVSKQPFKNKGKLKGLQTLDRFLLKEIPVMEGCKETSLSHSTPIKDLNRSKSCVSLEDITCDYVPLKQKRNSFNLSLLDASEDNASLNLSDIVNSIVSRRSCNPAVRIWTNKLK